MCREEAQAHIVRGPVAFFVAQDGSKQRDGFVGDSVSQMLGQCVEARRG